MTDVAANENSRRRIVLASLIGTSIEFYDFYVFLTAAILVFPKVFFPMESPTLAILSSLATFAVAFFARPIGAIVYGHFGDKNGRKSTLVASLLTMGIATVLIGTIPGYNVLGEGAALLLAVLRFAQGFGLGGDWSGAALIAVENAPANKRGLYGTLPQLGGPIGFFLANLLFLLGYLLLPGDAFDTWGWRIPFLLSAALVVIGFIVRRRLVESVVYQVAQRNNEIVRLPLVSAIKHNWRNMLFGTLAMLTPYVVFYLVTTFLLNFATSPTGFVIGGKTGLGIPRENMLIMFLVASVFTAGGIILAGRLSDRHGRRTLVIFAGIASVILGLLFQPWLNDGGGQLNILAFLVVGFAITGLISGPMGALLPELFPTEVRYTASAVTYNTASIIGAALSPILAVGLWAKNGDITFVGIYLAVTAVISLLAVLRIPETHAVALEDTLSYTEKRIQRARNKHTALEQADD